MLYAPRPGQYRLSYVASQVNPFCPPEVYVTILAMSSPSIPGLVPISQFNSHVLDLGMLRGLWEMYGPAVSVVLAPFQHWRAWPNGDTLARVWEDLVAVGSKGSLVDMAAGIRDEFWQGLGRRARGLSSEEENGGGIIGGVFT